MGVDVMLSLPPNVEAYTFAEALGKLLGCEAELKDVGGGYRSAKVTGIEVENSDVLGCVNVDIGEFHCLYQLEGPGGRRIVLLRSRAKNIALAKALADFFGGVVKDDDGDAFYVVPDKSDSENQPQDGYLWVLLQGRILTLPKLTQEQIDDCLSLAAYTET